MLLQTCNFVFLAFRHIQSPDCIATILNLNINSAIIRNGKRDVQGGDGDKRSLCGFLSMSVLCMLFHVYSGP
jgi:hypothetical protein